MEIVNTTKGEIITKSEPKEYKAGKFLQTFTLRTDEAYPTMLEFTLYDKGIAELSEKINEGSTIAIKFNVRGREYNERIYFTLQPWNIEVLNDSASEESTAQVNSPQVEDEDNPF